MANLKSRIAKLEAKSGVGQMHYLRVQVRAGESLENALNRAAKSKGIAPEDVGYVHLYGETSHLQVDYDSRVFNGLRVNGYKGPLEDVRGYVTHAERVLRLRKQREQETATTADH